MVTETANRCLGLTEVTFNIKDIVCSNYYMSLI